MGVVYNYVLKAKEMEPGYPVYCIYIPTGMNEDYESDMIKRLRTWGNNMGANVFVADWDIGDPSYRNLVKAIGNKKLPMVVFTDKNEIDKTSFILTIENVKNNDEFCDQLPELANLIMSGQNIQAAKEALRNKRKGELREIMRKIKGAKFSVTLSGFGFNFSVDNT